MDDIEIKNKLVDELLALPDPTYWFEILGNIRQKFGKTTGDTVAMLAKRAWLKKICHSYYPLHPVVKFNIQAQNYLLSENQNLLIWSTLIALMENDSSDIRYQKCKKQIEKKYSENAFLNVLSTAEKIKIIKLNKSYNISKSLNILAEKSITFQGWMKDEYLSSLPKKFQ
ncbi:hypothetical protein GY654_12275 [Vibrio parahaemolyticus]|nr:hypothetical protein [Vibrio parahaemolyticus]